MQNIFPQGKAFHHFGFSVICWAIWKCRNKAAFDGKRIKHPAEIFIHACAFMSYWTGLLVVEDQSQVAARVETMLKIAYRLLSFQSKPPGAQMLPAPQDRPADDEEED
jgi:hypothetical protein